MIKVISIKYLVFMVFLSTPAVTLSLVEKFTGWYVDNQMFMTFIAIAIFCDHLLGSYVHKKIKKDFTWKENRDGLFRKVGGSIIGYVLFEMFHQIVKDVDFIAIYLKVLLQLVTFCYPFFSALVNLSIATNGKYPPKGILKKFAKFEEDADLTIFKTGINENNQDTIAAPNDSDSD